MTCNTCTRKSDTKMRRGMCNPCYQRWYKDGKHEDLSLPPGRWVPTRGGVLRFEPGDAA